MTLIIKTLYMLLKFISCYKDILELKKSYMNWIKVDKSRNIYKISSSKYDKLLHNKITDNYKIDHFDTLNLINNDTAYYTV